MAVSREGSCLLAVHFVLLEQCAEFMLVEHVQNWMGTMRLSRCVSFHITVYAWATWSAWSY